MSEENKTNSETEKGIEPYLKEKFELYCIWKQIPYFLKFPPRDKKTKETPTSEQYCQMIGLEDDTLLQLIDIKNQTQFAQYFEVSKDTLTHWNKEIEKRDILQDIRVWASKLTKNVMAATYRHALHVPDARLPKLWLQIVHGWQEKAVVEHNYQGIKSITYEIIDATGHKEENQQEASGSISDSERQGN